jgi:hypothetical protein
MVMKTVVLIWESYGYDIYNFKFDNVSSTEYEWFKKIHNKFYSDEEDIAINSKLKRIIELIRSGQWDKYRIDSNCPIEGNISMCVCSGTFI